MGRPETFEEVRRQRLAAERRVVPAASARARGGPGHSIALGFPNRYEVGMSNLGFQWAMHVIEDQPGTGCERFFVEDQFLPPRTLDSGTPIESFPIVAFSVSWEMDFPLVLRALAAAGIPLRRDQRQEHDPIVVLGGNCARINPSPLFDYVDVIAAGDAEKLVPPLTQALLEAGGQRQELLGTLEAVSGFLLPDRATTSYTLIQQKRPREDFARHQVPHTVLLTPDTELSDKLLIEIARGCTEMCRFCWAAYAFAPIVRHSADAILAVANRARSLTGRVGLIATAVADHPEILPILRGLGELDYHVALSSLKIDAISEEILALLHAQGERALAIAPEAGNDALRRRVNKKIDDQQLEEKLRLIFRAGFTRLKLYLQIGLPGETEQDIDDLIDLLRKAHDIALEEGRPRGRIATVVASVNPFVPKPHTPFEGEHLAPIATLTERLNSIDRAVRTIPNTTLRAMPAREALWEAFLAKADRSAGRILERIATGDRPSRVMRQEREEIARVVWGEVARGEQPWNFLRKSPPPRRDAGRDKYAGELH